MPEASVKQVEVTRLPSGLVVAVYGTAQPSDAEWAHYLKVLNEMREHNLIIFSAGGGPNAVQRGELERATAQAKGQVAVITSSRVARGIVTAISWFNKHIKGFEPSRRNDAFAFLSLSDAERNTVLQEARRMAAVLGVSHILQLPD